MPLPKLDTLRTLDSDEPKQDHGVGKLLLVRPSHPTSACWHQHGQILPDLTVAPRGRLLQYEAEIGMNAYPL